MDRNEFFQILTIIFAVISIVIAVISIVIAVNANDIADRADKNAFQANEISTQANEIAFQAKSHTEMIEKSNLRLGDFKYSDKTISMHLVNSYYARYPAYVTSVFVDSEDLEINNISGEHGLLIERGKPVEFKINLEDYLTNKKDETSEMVIEFRYMELAEMEFKSMNLTYSIDISNHNITEFRPLDISDKIILKIQNYDQ